MEKHSVVIAKLWAVVAARAQNYIYWLEAKTFGSGKRREQPAALN